MKLSQIAMTVLILGTVVGYAFSPSPESKIIYEYRTLDILGPAKNPTGIEFTQEYVPKYVEIRDTIEVPVEKIKYITKKETTYIDRYPRIGNNAMDRIAPLTIIPPELP